jgi:hypothetical protein
MQISVGGIRDTGRLYVQTALPPSVFPMTSKAAMSYVVCELGHLPPEVLALVLRATPSGLTRQEARALWDLCLMQRHVCREWRALFHETGFESDMLIEWFTPLLCSVEDCRRARAITAAGGWCFKGDLDAFVACLA